MGVRNIPGKLSQAPCHMECAIFPRDSWLFKLFERLGAVGRVCLTGSSCLSVRAVHHRTSRKKRSKILTLHLARPLRWVLADHHRIAILARISDIPDCLSCSHGGVAVEAGRQQGGRDFAFCVAGGSDAGQACDPAEGYAGQGQLERQTGRREQPRARLAIQMPPPRPQRRPPQHRPPQSRSRPARATTRRRTTTAATHPMAVPRRRPSTGRRATSAAGAGCAHSGKCRDHHHQ